ncbi:hypothetical protein [Neisseria animalis]|nr:hypothetical protein [Neisseria animalis]
MKTGILQNSGFSAIKNRLKKAVTDILFPDGFKRHDERLIV